MTHAALALSTINGLPAHVLIVHLVVVFVPLSAVLLTACLRPSIAKRVGLALPVTALIALASVFAAMNAGDWLEQHVEPSSVLRHHTELGGQLWPFSLAVLLFATAVWWISRGTSDTAEDGKLDSGSTTRLVVIGVLSVIAATLSVVQVVRIGDSGSRAAWHDNFSHVAAGHD